MSGKGRRSRRAAAGFFALLALATPAAADQGPIRIGFVSTFSGPAAEIGAHMRNAFELALDDLGHHMGGRPVEVIYEDDRQQPETGAQQTRKLIEADHVDILTGYIWSNVLLASLKPALDAGVILVSAHAGPSQVAGELCSPLFFATGVQNDQTAAAVGLFMNQEGIGRAYLLSPNYAAGRDILAGFKTTFKGRVVRETYTRWPDHMDFSAEISAIRAAAPDAVFAFYPGAAGVQFLNQYAGAGLKDRIPLYTAFVIDEMTLPLQGENALGVPGAQEWVNDLPNEANRRFVAAYRAKYHLPPSYYDAEAYDAAQLIAGGLAAVGGDPRRREAMIAAMEKVPFAPVRGPFRFGNNHFPIQDFYLQTVQKRPDGTLGLATRATIVRGFQDAYHDRCPMK